MKVEFWKHELEFKFDIIFGTLFLIGVITFSILTIKFHYLWPMIFLFSFCFLLNLILLFENENILTKISFSNEGIECRRFGKQTYYLKWNNITDIKEKPSGKTIGYLIFISGEKFLNIYLTKKMYKAIMVICPSEQIKAKINSIERYKCFHRKEN